MIVGDRVIYAEIETKITEVLEGNKFVIINPFWDYDDEGDCVLNNIEYLEPYEIKVKKSDIKKIKQKNTL